MQITSITPEKSNGLESRKLWKQTCISLRQVQSIRRMLLWMRGLWTSIRIKEILMTIVRRSIRSNILIWRIFLIRYQEKLTLIRRRIRLREILRLKSRSLQQIITKIRGFRIFKASLRIFSCKYLKIRSSYIRLIRTIHHNTFRT